MTTMPYHSPRRLVVYSYIPVGAEVVEEEELTSDTEAHRELPVTA